MEKAKSLLLKEGLEEEEANTILKFTHCAPPEDYFIASYDMISKSGVWAHFGAWDFDRALVYNTLKKKEYLNNQQKSIEFLQNRFNYSAEKAQSIYYEIQSITTDKEANDWIAPWPSYGGGTDCGSQAKHKISCGIGNGLQVDIDTETLQSDIKTSQGIMHPDSIALPLKDGSFKEKTFSNSTIGISMTLIPRGEESYAAVLEHPLLAKSMFTRMFYLNGNGLKHFDKFSDVTDITGGRIIIWKVNWQGNSTNLLEAYQPKPVEEVTSPENTNNSQDINTADNSSVSE